ncbi:DUF4822 domain-containing protein [Nocardia sp. NPDC050712]|uniref:DUF4822 domain-containing protein n=1 Tax=Nocardia sp. NPDC050712 TaxID=3155518 RepID=UPI0033D45AFC
MTDKQMLTKKVVALAAATATLGLLGACSSDDTDDNSSSTSTVTTSTSTSAAMSTASSAPMPSSVQPGTPAATLAATAWETTSATNASGTEVPLTDDNVKNYVGYAYFKPDGTFTMVNLDDSPKMRGDWTVSPDGKTRTIVVKNEAGQEQSRRTVDIVALDDKEFTYRVYPDAADKAVYYDIIHTPTTHPEPR